MGKRSTFPRNPRDFYATPAAAVAPLLPFVAPKTRFVEPCAGDGALIDALAAAGHVCVGASDIHPMRADITPADALAAEAPPPGAVFITNPPWDRTILHALITRLSDLAPAWILWDADWLHTKQAAAFAPRIRKVVSIGRVKWIPGSKSTGKENAMWALLTRPSAAPTEFYIRGMVPPEAARPGRVCFDCRMVIGARDKWRLAERGGVPTTVHRQCENPTSYHPPGQGPLAPAPLFDDLRPRLGLTIAPGLPDDPGDPAAIPQFTGRGA